MDHQKNRALIQFLTFNAIGMINVVLTLALYFLLIAMGWHYLLALAAEYAFGICFSFFMNKRFTFQVRAKTTSTMFGKMIGTYVLLFLGNLIILVFFVDILGINPYLGQVIAFSSLMILAFIMQKFYVFRVATVRS
ncbi:GtrA family protein [Desulfonatronum thioautotrophicum]|uniref:GtrA family protein n=1 Tax=Desulfonatronum thioautotrophicum TaxID=617001 RepID=UPI0005EBE518|nr:GtrA family protein [Desulfonatronum thioautotrophicum]